MSSWTFKIAEPGQEPRELEVRPGMTLGRNKQCSCVLKDDSASSRHVRVLEDGEGLAIEDLGSTNGTRLESGSVLVRGSRQRLVEGLRFWLGETEVLVREEKKAAPPPPPKAPPAADMEQTVARSPAPARAPEPPPAARAPRAPAPETAPEEATMSGGSPFRAGPAPAAPASPAPTAEAVEEAPTLSGAVPFRPGGGSAPAPRPAPEAMEEAPTLGGASPFLVRSEPAAAPPQSSPGVIEEAPTLSGGSPFRMKAEPVKGPAPAAPAVPEEEAPTLSGGMQFAFRVGPEALGKVQAGPGAGGPFVMDDAARSPPDEEMTMLSAGAAPRAGSAPPPRAASPQAAGAPSAEPASPPQAMAAAPAAPQARAGGPFEATQRSAPSPGSQASLEALDPRIILILSQFKRVVRIRGPEFIVGRGEDVDLEIVHPTISNRHAVIRFERGTFTIEDAESKNGTFLDKAQLRPNLRQELRPESHIRFAAADGLFLAKDPAGDRGGAPLDERAARILVQRRKVTAAQVKSASSGGGHLGERLLLETDLQVSDWVGAVREASMSGAPSLLGGKAMWIAAGALAAVLLALVLAWLWR